MRSKIANALRKYFTERLRQKWPSLNEAKNNDLPSGCRLYEWRLETNLKFYLLLQPSSNSERFTIELVWTKNNEYPFSNDTMFPYDEPVNGSLRFRIGKLWSDPKTDFWWWIVPPQTPAESLRRMKERDFSQPSIEELLPKVYSLVDDAIFHIQKYVIPYMQEIAKKHGDELNP